MSRVSVAEPPEDPEGWEELETIARGLPQGQWFEGKPWNQGGCVERLVWLALLWCGVGRDVWRPLEGLCPPGWTGAWCWSRGSLGRVMNWSDVLKFVLMCWSRWWTGSWVTWEVLTGVKVTKTDIEECNKFENKNVWMTLYKKFPGNAEKFKNWQEILFESQTKNNCDSFGETLSCTQNAD